MSKNPIRNGILRHLEEGWDRYHTPGHNGGKGISQEVKKFLGEQIFNVDVTELPGLDDLHAPSGIIKESQDGLAQLFGADATHLLVNGSSAGVIAMLMSITTPGDKVIIPRNAHKSAYHGLILSGAEPIYLPVDYDSQISLAHNINFNELIKSLYSEKGQDAKGLLLTSPSYHGVCLDLGELSSELSMPLLVDEAHGAHLIFSDELPSSASDFGGDMWVHSTHKTLGTLTQSSLLHAKNNSVDLDNVSFMLQLVQSTSPSYPLMVSLDSLLAREQEYYELWNDLVRDRLPSLRTQIQAIPGLDLLTEKDLQGKRLSLDITKLTIKLGQLMLTGYELAEYLKENHSIQVELAERDVIVLLITPFHTENQFRRLVKALEQAVEKRKQLSNKEKINSKKYTSTVSFNGNEFLPKVEISPREAVYRQGKYVILSDSVGEIAQEFVIPYPPGIPLVVPGEVITAEICQYLEELISNYRIHLQGLRYGESGYIKVISRA